MTSILLVFVKKYWYHLVLVGLTITAAGALRGCINERDDRIRERATRNALIARDSLQVAALRDSVIFSRSRFDSTAKALRSALSAYEAIRRTAGSRINEGTKPLIERASVVGITNIDNVSPAEVIAYCKEFVLAAESYKLYADSTIAAQGRMIDNLTFQPTVHKRTPLKLLGTVALAGVVGGYLLAKSF